MLAKFFVRVRNPSTPCESLVHRTCLQRRHMWGLKQPQSHDSYAASAWWGFTAAADRQRLERFLCRTQHMGYLPAGTPTVEARVGLAENRLLQAVVWNHSHVLLGLFPSKISRAM